MLDPPQASPKPRQALKYPVSSLSLIQCWPVTLQPAASDAPCSQQVLEQLLRGPAEEVAILAVSWLSPGILLYTSLRLGLKRL